MSIYFEILPIFLLICRQLGVLILLIAQHEVAGLGHLLLESWLAEVLLEVEILLALIHVAKVD